MYLNLHRTDDACIRELLANPILIHHHMAAYESWYDVDVEVHGTAEYIPSSRLDSIELDKAWHGLHFLLCGNAWEGESPFDFLLAGGSVVGEEDIGYGPARALYSDEVAAIHMALSDITAEELESRFESQRFIEAEIYPGGWGEDSRDETIAFLLHHFQTLKDFVGRTTTDGKGIVICMV